ncbi:choice-of-anchor D domain-containing protein [bacterium]|nr:choice-of-anchor D domain-containing protein [bacterium]
MFAQQLGQWVEQPIAVPVRGLMGISMADTGRGYAVGDVNVLLGQTGVLIKHTGDPTWHPVAASAFSPALNISLASWAQDVYAIPNTGVAFISWRDDYRSLVYKTNDGGLSWFSVSPLNPILYGTRYTVVFKDIREGMIVGEGPGRVHRTTDGGVSWTSFTVPVRLSLTDVDFSGTFWNVSGGENSYFRYLPSNNRWINLSFPRATEFYSTHMKTSFVDDDNAYVNGYNSGTGNHVMVTENGGIDWMPVPAQPNFRSTPEGHKGIHFFDTLKGWVASDYDEFAYTENGGYTWAKFTPLTFGNKVYRPVNKMVFLNEAVGWAVGGIQRTDGYPSVSDGYIYRWYGTQKPDISGTATIASFDTLRCADYKNIQVPITNTGTGNLTIPAGGVSFAGAGFIVTNTSFPFTVAPGQTRYITVRWTPGAGYFGEIPPASRMIIESNDTDHTPWTISLRGMRLLSELQLVNAKLLFPTSCLGDSAVAGLAVVAHGNLAPMIVKVENTGRGEIFPLSHLVGDTVATIDTLWFALGGALDGAMSGDLSIVAGDTSCPATLTIPFEGFIESNTLKFTPDHVDFKEVCVGQEATEYLEVKNLGTQEGRIVAVQMLGGDAGFFIDADTSEYIAPGASTRLPVRFIPQQADSTALAAAFRVLLGPCADTVDVYFEGQGVLPEFTVLPDSMLVIGPVPLNIDVDRIVSVRNSGMKHIVISGLELRPPVPGLQILSPTGFPLQFNTGDSLGIALRYRAQVPDSIHTALRLTWAEPCPDTLVYPLLLISDRLPFAEHPDTLRFFDQICEDAVLDSFLLRNAGQQPLLLNRGDIIGRDPSHFRLLAPQLPLTLPADSSVFFVLSYDAPANVESRAALQLQHNDSTVFGKSTVHLLGRRNVRTLEVEGDTVKPMALCVGVPGTRRFVFRNPHDAPLHLTDITLGSGAPFVSLKHDALPTDVPPDGGFTLTVTGDFPIDTVVTVVVRAQMEPCSVEYLLRFEAGVFHPAMTVLPDPLDFGVRSLSDTARIMALVQNSDSIDVEVGEIYLSGVSGALTLDPPPMLPKELLPDSLLRVSLKLRMMKDTGSYAGSLCVVLSHPCLDTLCFPLGMMISDEGLLADADTASFIFAFCDTLQCDSVTVTNTLTSVQVVEASVTNPAVFSVSPDTAVQIEPGASAIFVVCAVAPTAGDARGELLLRGSEGALSVVQLYAQYEKDGLQLPDTLDAGNVPYCETGREFVLLLRNTARIDEVVQDMQVAGGPFTVLTQPPYYVRGGGEVAVRLRFDPVSTGSASAQLTLTSVIGNCTRISTVTLIGRYGGAYIETVPSTLLFANVVAGSSQTRTLEVRNRDMQGLRLAEIMVSPNPPFSASLSLPLALDTGAVLDIPVTFLPDSIGSFFASICLVFDQPCADTVCIDLEGEGIDGDIVYSVPELRYDTLAQCESQLLTALLRNTGSANVELKSSVINGPSAAAYTIENPVVSAETIAAGTNREFRVRYDGAAATDGPVAATLFVSTDAPKQPVVELPLQGWRVTQVTPAEIRVILGDVLLGSPRSFTADGRNDGSAALRYTAVLPAEYALDISAATVLSPVTGFSLPFQFNPSAEGPFTDTLRLALQPCEDSLLIIVSGDVTRPFVQTDVDYLQVPVCQSREAEAELHNNSGEEMEVLALAIEGAYASRYSFVNAPATPFPLASAASRRIAIRFTPRPGDAGDLSAELRSDVRIDGQVHSFRSLLRAEVFDGGLDFANPLPLGSAAIGEESGEVGITGYNNSAFPVSVAALQPVGPGLRVTGTEPALPAQLLPGDSLVVRLTFTPDRQGWIDDTLLLTATAPCEVALSVPVRYEGRGDLFPLTITAADAAGGIDDTVSIPILLSRDISGLGVTAFSGSLHYDGSMLYPTGVTGEGSASVGMQLSWTSNAAGEVVFHGNNGMLSGGSDTLLTLRFLVLIGYDSVSTLRPAACTFSHPAIDVTEYVTGLFTLEGYCLAGGSRLLSADSDTLGRISPHPLTERSQTHVHIAQSGAVHLGIYDLQGREVQVLRDGLLSAGDHVIMISADGLPAGSYLLVLRTAQGTQARRFTLMR